jgi:hypothetical protein
MDVAFTGLLLVVALGSNVALGMWRRRLRPFSPTWFVAIHASIPLLVAMRLALARPNGSFRWRSQWWPASWLGRGYPPSE